MAEHGEVLRPALRADDERLQWLKNKTARKIPLSFSDAEWLLAQVDALLGQHEPEKEDE